MITKSVSRKVAQDIVEENFPNSDINEPINIVPDYQNKLIRYYYRLPANSILDKRQIPRGGEFTNKYNQKFKLLLIDVEIVIGNLVRTTYMYNEYNIIENKEGDFTLTHPDFPNAGGNVVFNGRGLGSYEQGRLQSLERDEVKQAKHSNSSGFSQPFENNAGMEFIERECDPPRCIGLCIPACRDCATLGGTAM